MAEAKQMVLMDMTSQTKDKICLIGTEESNNENKCVFNDL